MVDWRSRIYPDDVDRVVAASLAGEASQQPFTLEARYLRHDGEYRWLRSVSQPRFGPDRQLSGFIGVASDITVAKEAELELRREVDERTCELALSEARFRAVFDTVLEVLVLMEPDGTVVELNRKQASWRAPNPRDSIGGKVWDAPTFGLYPQYVKLMKRAVRTAASGKIFSEEVRLEREGAPTAHVDVSVQPVRGPDDQILYLLFEARDVTDLKAAQEQLRQSQKMEALGQLTGGIAHDFNNLLTVVVGGLDIIAKRAEDERLKRYAVNALAAADRGARLTGQLLAFSRVQRLEVRPTHVRPLIDNMRPLLRNVLGPGIVKQFDLDHEMMPVMADPTQLEVAVLNLAINARDAMPDGGLLRFTSKAVQVDNDPELEPGTYIELCISDTGVGMPGEIAARAFEPFFTTKEIGKGTGLWPVDGLRNGPAVGRHRQDREHARCRHGGEALFSPGRPRQRRATRPRLRRTLRTSRRNAGRRRCWSSTTTPMCGPSSSPLWKSRATRSRGPRWRAGPCRPRPQKAGPRHSRLHHAGPVRCRSREPDPRRRAASSPSCSSPATARRMRSSASRRAHRFFPSPSAAKHFKRRSGERSAHWPEQPPGLCVPPGGECP